MVNHRTGDRCHLKFNPYSYFSRDVPRKVRFLHLQHRFCEMFIRVHKVTFHKTLFSYYVTSCPY